MLRMIDLFSGIGGISLGAHMAGIETVAFCEIDPFPREVLQKNFPRVPIYGDIRELTKERLERDGVIDDSRTIDIISGGFPCQPFSVAGKRKGKNDERHLWPEMFRLIRELRPRWVVGENVAGIVKLALDDIIDELENEGYTARAFIIPACSVGAPHKRERVFIVAHSSRELSHRPRQTWNRWFEHTNGGENVADTNGARREKFNVAAFPKRPGFDSRGVDPDGSKRAIESGLGGNFDGFSDRLDGHKWPARYGEPQYEWEPPRTTTRRDNRSKRLKALGNAVVPQQIYPIFKAIVEIEKSPEV